MDEKYWRNLEKLFVHNVYEEISPYYDDEEFCANLEKRNSSNSINDNNNNNNKLLNENKQIFNRNTAWRKVKNFLLDLEPNSLVADIGCGNGKYLQINQSLFTIGCDICESLVNIASTQTLSNKNQLIICDNLNLPFRSNTFDAVISIGVIHHFSTFNRRANAIKELCRILKPGGKIMIYVWAYEQTLRKFDAQDVLIPSIKNNTIIKRNRHLSECTLTSGNSTESSTTKEQISSPNSPTINKTDLFLPNKNYQQSSSEILTNSLKSITKERILHQSISIDEKYFKNNKSKTQSSTSLYKDVLINKKNSNSNSFISTITTFFSQKFLTTTNISDENLIKKTELNNNNNNNFLDYYNRLLENNNKTVLPKDFQIRQFPMSSCENTFNANENNNNNIDNEKININEQHRPLGKAINSTNVNYTLKRYYHVFKENELDLLINETVEDMIVYKSYYDRCNWCICAQKQF